MTDAAAMSHEDAGQLDPGSQVNGSAYAAKVDGDVHHGTNLADNDANEDADDPMSRNTTADASEEKENPNDEVMTNTVISADSRSHGTATYSVDTSQDTIADIPSNAPDANGFEALSMALNTLKAKFGINFESLGGYADLSVAERAAKLNRLRDAIQRIQGGPPLLPNDSLTQRRIQGSADGQIPIQPDSALAPTQDSTPLESMRNLSLSPGSRDDSFFDLRTPASAPQSAISKTGAKFRATIASDPRFAKRIAARRRALSSLARDDVDPPSNSPCPVFGCRSKSTRTNHATARRCDRCHGHTHLPFLFVCSTHGGICTLCAQVTANGRIHDPNASGRVPGSKKGWINFGKMTDARHAKVRRSEPPNLKVSQALHDVRHHPSPESSPHSGTNSKSEMEDSDNSAHDSRLRPTLRRRTTRTSLKDYDSDDLEELAHQEDRDAALEQQEKALAAYKAKKRSLGNFNFNISGDEPEEMDDAEPDPTPATKKRRSNSSRAISTGRAKAKKAPDAESFSQDERDAARLTAHKDPKALARESAAVLRKAAEHRGTKLCRGIRKRWSSKGQPRWNISSLAEVRREKERLLRIEPCFRRCCSKRKQTPDRFARWLQGKGISAKLYRTVMHRTVARERVLVEREAKLTSIKAKPTGEDKSKPRTKARSKSSTLKSSAPTPTSLATGHSAPPIRPMDVCL